MGFSANAGGDFALGVARLVVYLSRLEKSRRHPQPMTKTVSWTKDKKGMETWQLVLIILALILLLVVLGFFFGLNVEAKNLLQNFGDVM